MKQSITFSGFCDAFRDCDRNDQFTYEAKRVLFDFLEQYEEDTGTEVELDVIALCCEYYESSWEEIAADYSIDLSDCDEDEDKIEVVRDYLNDNTMVAGETGSGTNIGFVYAAF